MKLYFIAVGTAVLMTTAAIADGHATGDAAAGEKGFKKCKSRAIQDRFVAYQ